MVVLKFIAAVLAIALLIYGKYRQQRWISDQRDYKSGLRTLFDGEQ